MMNDMPNENQDVVAREDRAEWVRPEVTRMRAGDAENAANPTFDGGAGLS